MRYKSQAKGIKNYISKRGMLNRRKFDKFTSCIFKKYKKKKKKNSNSLFYLFFLKASGLCDNKKLFRNRC